MKYDESGPVVILAPHLDDAVLSCFATLSRREKPVYVVSLFAGVPGRTLAMSRWDELCGFPETWTAAKVMRARRVEDVDALADLAEPIHGDLLDNMYRKALGQTTSTIAVATHALRLLGDLAPSRLLAPASISPTPHPDHSLTRDAAISIARPNGIPLDLYGDLPHCLKGGHWPELDDAPVPTYWQRCLALLPLADSSPSWAALTPDGAGLKAARMRRYASQFRGLTTALREPGRSVLKRPDLYGVEVSWRLEGNP